MTVDPTVVPGLALFTLELLALAATGFVVARVALRQSDDLAALAQGLVIGLALWGLAVNFVMYLVPGRAGALVAWAAVSALGVSLAYRAPSRITPSPRTLVGFALAALFLFCGALAVRQTLLIPDFEAHLGLAASIRAGGFPPVLPWNPEQSAPYHYGVDMLIGLLTPPFGPDLAFVTELVCAYVWTGFALIVVSTLKRRASWPIVLVLCPLLLTAGGWTLAFREPAAPTILQVLVPAGLPAAGIRASLTDIYWPAVEWPWPTEIVVSPPNIWKPAFVLAYALAMVILERLAASHGRSAGTGLTLAVLVGFLGLVGEAMAALTLLLWVLLTAVESLSAWHGRRSGWQLVARAAVWPTTAGFLLLVGGGILTDALVGSSASGISLGWIADAASRRPLGSFRAGASGIGLLGLGPAIVALVAGLLAWRNRLVSTLAVGSGVSLLAAFVVQYAIVPHDVYRFDGHARTLALLALLISLSSRLQGLGRGWRCTAVAGFVVLAAWPTVAAPARTVAVALNRGVQVANALPEQREFDGWLMGRYGLPHAASRSVVAYVRAHIPVDARVLSPRPQEFSIVTGRPNAAGFAELLHLRPKTGSEYNDAIRYLDPAAVKRLGGDYVHASEAWIAALPHRAQRWLADPELFELLIRDGADSLYRVRAAFLDLNVQPDPESFEALRHAVPADATVYLSPALEPLASLRAAATLSHTRLFGVADPEPWHLLTEVAIAPLQGRTTDFVLTASRLTPSGFPPELRHPIWWNDEIAVYSTSSLIGSNRPRPRDVSVRLLGANVDDGRLGFTVVFANRASYDWQGQDWIVAPIDESGWDLPAGFELDERTYAGVQWYAGQVTPSQKTAINRYLFDPLAATLTVRGARGDLAAIPSSGTKLEPGRWILALRLRGDWWEAAFIPVARIQVTATGDVRYSVYEGPLDATLTS